MAEYIKCETCLYNKNCQFLAKHKNVVVKGCSAYKNATDMVEVVRCKDCKHASILTQSNNIICYLNSALFIVEENHFCSYGERECDNG